LKHRDQENGSERKERAPSIVRREESGKSNHGPESLEKSKKKALPRLIRNGNERKTKRDQKRDEKQAAEIHAQARKKKV